MVVISIAATEGGDDAQFGAIAGTLVGDGHDASVGPPESADARAPGAQFVARFKSEEDGAGLARAAKHLFLAWRRTAGEFPERIAFYDHSGRLLNDADSSLV
jgi:hypothetical protein